MKQSDIEEIKNELALDNLRNAARVAAQRGFYGHYLLSVVRIAIKDETPANPDEEDENG